MLPRRRFFCLFFEWAHRAAAAARVMAPPTPPNAVQGWRGWKRKKERKKGRRERNGETDKNHFPSSFEFILQSLDMTAAVRHTDRPTAIKRYKGSRVEFIFEASSLLCLNRPPGFPDGIIFPSTYLFKFYLRNSRPPGRQPSYEILANARIKSSKNTYSFLMFVFVNLSTLHQPLGSMEKGDRLTDYLYNC